MSSASRILGAGLVLGLVVGGAAGVGLAAASGLGQGANRTAASGPAAGTPASPVDDEIGAGGAASTQQGVASTVADAAPAGVGIAPSGGGVASSGTASGGVASAGMPTTGTASAGTAIAFPYMPGTTGVAPDHTIVVTGVGQADLAGDGSNRAAAEKTALDAALADARAQATIVASATGLAISGVLSVNTVISPSYGIMPLAGTASGSGGSVPLCPPAPANGPATGGPQPNGSTVAPQPACPPVYQQTLMASVTVAYKVA